MSDKFHGAAKEGTYRDSELLQPGQEVIGDGDLLIIFAPDGGKGVQFIAKSGDLGLKVSCSHGGS